MSNGTKLTEKEYYDAITDLSAIKHLSLSKLIDDADEVSGFGYTLSKTFGGKKLMTEMQSIESVLSLLVDQYGLSSKGLNRDAYGKWHLSDEQQAKLRTLYRNERLQALVDGIRNDERLVDDYAHQDYIEKKNRPKYVPLDNPPAVRNEDLVKDFKNSVSSKMKKYERAAAKNKLNETRSKYRDMMKKASSHKSSKSSYNDSGANKTENFDNQKSVKIDSTTDESEPNW